MNEISFMHEIHSPHVISFKYYVKTQNSFYIVTELCNGFDMNKLRLKRGGYFSELEARELLK